MFDTATIRRALPGQLFYSTQIPVCLWFLANNKNAGAKRSFRDGHQQNIAIDARKRAPSYPPSTAGLRAEPNSSPP